jgi:hypothetical protein
VVCYQTWLLNPYFQNNKNQNNNNSNNSNNSIISNGVVVVEEIELSSSTKVDIIMLPTNTQILQNTNLAIFINHCRILLDRYCNHAKRTDQPMWGDFELVLKQMNIVPQLFLTFLSQHACYHNLFTDQSTLLWHFNKAYPIQHSTTISSSSSSSSSSSFRPKYIPSFLPVWPKTISINANNSPPLPLELPILNGSKNKKKPTNNTNTPQKFNHEKNSEASQIEYAQSVIPKLFEQVKTAYKHVCDGKPFLKINPHTLLNHPIPNPIPIPNPVHPTTTTTAITTTSTTTFSKTGNNNNNKNHFTAIKRKCTDKYTDKPIKPSKQRCQLYKFNFNSSSSENAVCDDDDDDDDDMNINHNKKRSTISR